jgi:hypothetical protein
VIDAVTDAITSDEANGYFQVRTWRATAGTWFEKVAVSLRRQYDKTASTSTRHLLAEEAARLLVNVLSHAQRLVAMLQEDTMHTFSDVEREAQALVKVLRNERLAAKMENMTGRTEEEAAAFRAKAAELRS